MPSLSAWEPSDEERERLDETVHDVASKQASDAINNNEQVKYLLAAGWTESEIHAAAGGF